MRKNYFKRGIKYIKRNGPVEGFYKAFERLVRDDDEKNYSENFIKSRPDREELDMQKKAMFNFPYFISILVPCYNTESDLFLKMVDCVATQTYKNWELILVDASETDRLRNDLADYIAENSVRIKAEYDVDIRERIRYKFLGFNKGISNNTNEALNMARGRYIALLDHDDLIEQYALYEVVSALNSRVNSDGSLIRLVYSEEDKTDYKNTYYFDYHQKPDYDIHLLRTNNYICHFLCVETNLTKSVGGFNNVFDGAQDYDFILRCCEELNRDSIYHIPKVLYHWRSTKGSTSENPDAKMYAYAAGKRAIGAHLLRMNEKASVNTTNHLGFYRVEYNNLYLGILRLSRSEYEKLSVSDFDNIQEPFIMVLDDSLLPLSSDYEEHMLSFMQRDKVGVVTGKILSKSGKVESAGYVKDSEGNLYPKFLGLNKHFSGYLHRAILQQEVDECDRGLMLIRKSAMKNSTEGRELKAGYEMVYDPQSIFMRR